MEYLYRLSKQSLKELKTCSPSLQEIFQRAIKSTPLDFTIIQGARTLEQAREAYSNGASRLAPDKGDFSKHLIGHFSITFQGKTHRLDRDHSLAIDICPSRGGRLLWDDHPSFYLIAGIIWNIAHHLHIPIRYGGGWNLHRFVNHLNTKDQLMDLGHFEIIDSSL